MSDLAQKFELAVETSGRIGSVAILKEGLVLLERSMSGFMKHSAELFEIIAELTQQAGIRPGAIQTLYITVGPGSFTGIRIAVTLAKMMGYALNSRIVAVDTLDALAENAADIISTSGATLRRVATILDAKQNRFFAALYEYNGQELEKIYPSSLVYPEELLAIINKDNVPTGLLGEGLVYYADKFKSPLTMLLDEATWPATARGVYAAGRKMAAKGQFSDIYTLVPAYIRKPDAVEKRELKEAH